MTARYVRELDPVMGRAQQLSVFEQQRSRAELVNELPELLDQVTADAVQAAAATLRPDNRAVLELRPETSS
jgi:predicted Zn-dependent peptidase